MQIRMKMIAGRHSVLAVLLVMLICVPLLATVIAQEGDGEQVTEAQESETEFETTDAEDIELPIGVELAARFHEIAEAHKAEIEAIIEEFKFNNAQNHQERLRIIEEYHNQIRLRLEETKTERTRLREMLNDGTIDQDEFLARMRLLKASVKGCERVAYKLGWQLSEVAKMASEQHRQKAQMLKDLHEQMREEMKLALQQMKEEMKSRRGPPWMTTETTTETETTTTSMTGGATEATTVTTTGTTTTSGSGKGGGKGKGGS